MSESSGTYVAVKFKQETLDELGHYLRWNDIPNPVPLEELHSTIVYSREHIDWIPENHIDKVVNTNDSVLEVWDTADGKRCLVWHYYSYYQHKRFKEAMEMGATYDFDTYKCHITLSYDVGDFDVCSVHNPDFNILLDHEIVEDLED